MTRKHSAAYALSATQDTLPSGRRWITWGVWPSPDARLHVSDEPGLWAFVGTMECGHLLRAVLLVRWHLRTDRRAERVVAPIEAVWMEGQTGR